MKHGLGWKRSIMAMPAPEPRVVGCAQGRRPGLWQRVRAWRMSQECAVVVLVALAGGYAPVGTVTLVVLGWFGIHGVQFPCYTGRGC